MLGTSVQQETAVGQQKRPVRPHLVGFGGNFQYWEHSSCDLQKP